MKKILIAIFTAVMVLGLCVPAVAKADSDDKVYEWKFASESSTESLRYVYVEKVIMEEIEARSNGRIKFTYFPSGSIASSGTMIQAISDGLCDMGIEFFSNYTGTYLYTELLGTPGVYMGDTYMEQAANLAVYSEKYASTECKDFHLMSQFPTLDFYIFTNFEVNSIDDFKGKNIYSSPTYIPLFTDMGSSTVNMPPPEVYESFRLNVLDGGIGALGMINTFKLYEVCKYAYKFPNVFAEQTVIMSSDKYNELPDDLKAVVDEVSAEIPQMMDNMRVAIEEDIQKNVEGKDFTFTELPADVQENMASMCDPLLEAKVAELNAAGRDGDGALDLIKSFAK